MRGHTEYIDSIAWTADGENILSSSRDSSTRLWNVAWTPESRVLDRQTALADVVAFSRDGSRFATIAASGPVIVRNAATGQFVEAFGGGMGHHTSVSFHPDGQRIAVGHVDGKVRLFHLEGTHRELPGHASGVAGLAFSPDGERLATCSDDKTARILGVERGEILDTLDRHENFVWAIDWSPDGRRIATGGHDGKLMLWDADTGERLRACDILNFPNGMTFSPDSTLVATPAHVHGVDLISVETGEVVHRLRGHSDSIRGIAFSPDGRRVFTSSWDRTIKIWDPASGQETLTLPSEDKVNAIALSPNGGLLVGVGDHTLTMWFAPVPPPATTSPAAPARP
jgi:WD40 repeat protein